MLSYWGRGGSQPLREGSDVGRKFRCTVGTYGTMEEKIENLEHKSKTNSSGGSIASSGCTNPGLMVSDVEQLRSLHGKDDEKTRASHGRMET